MARGEGSVIHHPDDYMNPGERPIREYDEDAPPLYRDRCQCGRLPGACPGPENCPMVEDEE
jgi:hypothetical protein